MALAGGGVRKTNVKGAAASSKTANPFKQQETEDVLGPRDGEAVLHTVEGLYNWTKSDARFFEEVSKMPKATKDAMLDYLGNGGKHRADVRIRAVLEMSPLFISGHALIKKLTGTMAAIEKSFGSQIWEAVIAQTSASDGFNTDVFRLLVQASSV
jgi:hypothetical protein